MKVLGIGNALVDIMTSIEDDIFLKENNLPKGSMQLVGAEQVQNLLVKISGFKQMLSGGGSAANTINGLSKLGVKTGFKGKIGSDDIGKFFIEDLQKNNITPHVSYSNSLSGRAIALVSKDGERTFATFLGAAVEMTSNDIDDELFNNYDLLHIEGYLLQNYDLIEKCVKVAKRKGLKVSLDLASYNVVESNLDFLNRLIPQNVDILFANEEEAKAFTGLEPEKSVLEIGKMTPCSIVKIGEKGSLVYYQKELTRINAIKSTCIDTTGAGDLYAAGFIYGLLNKKSILDSGKLASILSGKVISVIGSKMEDQLWQNIYSEINSI